MTDRPGEGTGHGPSAHGPRGDLVGRAWSKEEALSILESPDRVRTQDPAAVWERVGLSVGEVVADVGAGTGYFALPAARRVGPSGRVYAVDLSEELVRWLEERRDREGVPQLIPVRSSPDAIPLPSESVDVVLLANVLHDLPPSTANEAVRILKPDGRLVNVDWKKAATPGGPPVPARLAPEEAIALLTSRGLRLVERWEFGPWHYALTFRRARSESPRSSGSAGPTR